MFTILHISDLHRSKEEPIDNQTLLASLLADQDRYAGENPRIPPPEAIVVSGDIIRGSPIGIANWQQCIRDQYAVAGDFLNKLSDRYLNGDKSRIVLVPGNHDVCWNSSYKAMEQVPNANYPENLYEALTEADSKYRWSWKTQALFRISDLTTYEKRLDYYWDFVETFYKGVNLPVQINRSRGFQFFEFSNRRIVVAAFDSIAGNDCFSHSGSIPRGAIGKCAIDLRDQNHSYNLKIAVWHHSVQGSPARSDYMDASHLQEMIGHGFQLGLHGHQHIASTLTQFVYLDQSKSMAVISAGSLCAGNKELPRGVNRQYNLIVIDNNFTHARVHVREMGEGEQFTRKRSGEFIDGSVEISWQPSTEIMGAEIDVQENNTRRAICNAETALYGGRPHDAVQALNDINLSSAPYARSLMIQALLDQKDWSNLTRILKDPNTVEESVILVSALIESNCLDNAQTRLNVATDVDAATRAELQNKIATRKLMR